MKRRKSRSALWSPVWTGVIACWVIGLGVIITFVGFRGIEASTAAMASPYARDMGLRKTARELNYLVGRTSCGGPEQCFTVSRRMAMWGCLLDPSCMDLDSRIRSLRTGEPQDRRTNRLYIHIPKCGGTAVCAELQSLAVALPRPKIVNSANCWEWEDGPVWYFKWPKQMSRVRQLSCEERGAKSKVTFKMIERPLDQENGSALICGSVKYGVTFREPVERTFSHNQLYRREIEPTQEGEEWPEILAKVDSGKDPNQFAWDARKRIFFTDNYFVRFFLGRSLEPSYYYHRVDDFHLDHPPGSLTKEHLKLAAEALLKVDWIFLLSQSHTTCYKKLYSKFIPESRFSQRHSGSYKDISNDHGLEIPEGYYQNTPVGQRTKIIVERWNALDKELFRLASFLFELDCRYAK